ncbi:sigma-E factor negative regulatory protein [Lysobacter xanthus]
MNANDMSEHDREVLSALHDGELDGEARLFALRRLSHDAAWQADIGRWQLIGDAMRRQAPIAAPSDFAERVRRDVAGAQVAVPSVPAVAPVATPRQRPALRWVGGALAASLAVVGVFALRGAPEAAPTAEVASTATGVSGPVEVAAPTPAVVPAVPTLPVAPITNDGAAPRVATAPRAPSSVRASRREAAPVVTATPAAETAVAAVAVPVAPNPFHVPAADPLAPRPWPRAALAGPAGALTASYGTSEPAQASPSFFPFEPKPRAEAGADAPSP